MTDYQIGEAADILGVTTRTLRHWDAVGLLSPGWRTGADYRLYTDGDLDRGWEIIIYRAAGLSLKDIQAVLTEPASRREALERQRDVLSHKIGHLHGMIRAVDELLERGETMTNEEKHDLIDPYREEAEARWGGTKEWEQSQEVLTNMSEQDIDDVKRRHADFVDELAEAKARHIKPGSREAAALVEKHRATIAQWYDAERSRQVILARMYVADERFNETYRGNAAYLLELVEAQAKNEGLDPDEAEW